MPTKMCKPCQVVSKHIAKEWFLRGFVRWVYRLARSPAASASSLPNARSDMFIQTLMRHFVLSQANTYLLS
jgi:hypothetical protein